MSSTTERSDTKTVRKIAAAAILAGALFIYFQSVLSVRVSDTPFLDLPPEPDAAEYFAGGVSLVREGTFAIHLAGEHLPSRYPFGYSALIAVWLACADTPSIEAPFAVNRLAGGLLILTVFGLCWTRKAYLEAGLASLLIVTLPAFLVLSRSPMSEVSSALLVVVGFYGLYRFVSGKHLVWGLLGTFFLGVSLWFKLSNLFLLPGIPAAALFASGTLQQKLKCSVLLCGAWVASAIPLLFYQWFALGGVFRTGYSFWLPDQSALLDIFHWSFLARNLDYLAAELLLNQNVPTVASRYGQGHYFGIAFVVLCGIGIWRNRGNRSFRLLAAVGLLYCAILLFYFFQDFRLFFPVLVLGIPWIAKAWIRAFRDSSTVPRVLLVLFFLFQVGMFPGSDFDPDFMPYLTPNRLNGPAPGYGVVREFLHSSEQVPALILTDLNPAYTYALVGPPRTVSFLTDDHDYRFNERVFRYGAAERCTQIREFLARGMPVYGLVAVPGSGSLDNPCPDLVGTSWSVTRRLSGGGLLARLQPPSSDKP